MNGYVSGSRAASGRSGLTGRTYKNLGMHLVSRLVGLFRCSPGPQKSTIARNAAIHDNRGGALWPTPPPPSRPGRARTPPALPPPTHRTRAAPWTRRPARCPRRRRPAGSPTALVGGGALLGGAEDAGSLSLLTLVEMPRRGALQTLPSERTVRRCLMSELSLPSLLTLPRPLQARQCHQNDRSWEMSPVASS